MGENERNAWVIEHIEEITSCVKRYSERFCLDFDDLYSEIIDYIFTYLIEHGKPKTGISAFVGNRIHKIMDIQNKKIEDPHYCFELTFLKDYDFEQKVILEALMDKAELSEYQRNLLHDLIVDECTILDVSRKYKVTYKHAREDYAKAIRKLRSACSKLRVGKDVLC